MKLYKEVDIILLDRIELKYIFNTQIFKINKNIKED